MLVAGVIAIIGLVYATTGTDDGCPWGYTATAAVACKQTAALKVAKVSGLLLAWPRSPLPPRWCEHAATRKKSERAQRFGHSSTRGRCRSLRLIRR